MDKEEEMSKTFIADVGQKSAIVDDTELLGDNEKALGATFPDIKVEPPKENDKVKEETTESNDQIESSEQKEEPQNKEEIRDNNINTNMYEKKPKKRNPLITILLMLLCLALGAGGTYYYFEIYCDKDNNDKIETTTEKEEKDNEIESLETVNEEAVTLYNNIYNANYSGIDDIYFTAKKVEAKDIENNLAFATALTIMQNNLIEKGNKNPYTNIGDGFTEAELQNQVALLFGEKYEMKNQDYNGCPPFKYDSANKKYSIESIPGCGFEQGPGNPKRIVKVLKTNDDIEIYVRILFLGSDTNTFKYYKDSTKTQLITGIKADSEGLALETEENLVKGGLYKITFTKENSNYIFVSSEPEK